MKQTNYQLFDFLDFDTALTGREVLWKACVPVTALTDGPTAVLEIPFCKQVVSNDMAPDPTAPLKNHFLRMTAYGGKILRVTMVIGSATIPDSPMLQIDANISPEPLEWERSHEEWLVRDQCGRVRAVLDLRRPATDPWSTLVPGPEETLNLSFFPDGDKKMDLSAYDQFFPARQEAFPLAYVEKEGHCHRMTISFHALPGERFAGTGERFLRMDLSGQSFQLKNQDAQGVNNRRAYKNIPFFLSSRMTGVFMHTSAYSKISLAGHSTRSVQLLTEEPVMDLFLIGGETPEEILFGYRQLTGFPAMPPLWSFGTWMSRMSYFSAEEVNTICRRLRKEEIPCDVIHIDTGWFRKDWLCEWKFNRERFPDPAGFIRQLKDWGFRVSLWQMPYIAADAEQHDEALQNRYMCILKKDVKQRGSNFSALDYAGTIDFTNPEAVGWYQGLLRSLLSMGVACIKTDFGEEIHMDAEYHAMEPELLNNLYALLYQRAAFEVTREVTGGGIIWARAAWAGCQRYPLHWGGDAACSWDGMAGTLRGGLHLGLSGFGFWSHDVPGFHGVPDFMNSTIPDDLYLRWTQFGVFTSHLRYHGTSKREPWEFPGVAHSVRLWLKLRYALIPYILVQSLKVTRSGFPLLRAMIFHHPDDPVCWHIDDQYFFGDDFLVAPVMNSSDRRTVYIPRGTWVNLFSGKRIRGSRWLKNYYCPPEEMPVWVRHGASVPVYPLPVNHTGEMDLSLSEPVVFDNTFKGLHGSFPGFTRNETGTPGHRNHQENPRKYEGPDFKETNRAG